MADTHTGFTRDCANRIRQALVAGGLYKLARKGLGRGLIGLALPAAALVIEDLSSPRGMILPFIRWVLSRHGRVKIIDISARPLQKGAKTGCEAEATSVKEKKGGG
jgi:hypothetical protein